MLMLRLEESIEKQQEWMWMDGVGWFRRFLCLGVVPFVYYVGTTRDLPRQNLSGGSGQATSNENHSINLFTLALPFPFFSLFGINFFLEEVLDILGAWLQLFRIKRPC